MLGKSRSSPLPSTFDSDDLPNVFSDYFTEKIRNVRNNCPPPNPTACPDTSFAGNPLLTFEPVTDEFVLKIINSAYAKSYELDPIPTTLLYENLDILSSTITNIINTSLTTGIVPCDLKTAVVKPLLKKPSLDKNLLKNYRPISNLTFLSKILEKVVLHKLLSHLQENNLSNPFQSAYRAGYSTETVLLRTVNDILSALDNDNISVLVLLDLSAALDTIDHQILLCPHTSPDNMLVGHTGFIGHSGLVGHAGQVGHAELMGHTGFVRHTGLVGHIGLVIHAGLVGHTGLVGHARLVGHTRLVGHSELVGHAVGHEYLRTSRWGHFSPH